VDRVGVLVGDFDAELLLDSHDDFYRVERVEAQVVGEVGGGLDLGSKLAFKYGQGKGGRQFNSVRWQCR
jgi:hypothetical protein